MMKKPKNQIGAYLRRMARQADNGHITAFAAVGISELGYVRTTWFDNEGRQTTIAGLAAALSGESSWNSTKQYFPKKYPVPR